MRAEQRRLAERCAAVDYHISHRIQPQFVMIVLDANHAIVRASTNVARVLAEPPEALLGRAVDDVLAGDLRGALALLAGPLRGRAVIEVTVRATGATTDAVVFPSGPYVCCELELPAPGDRALLLASQLAAAIGEADGEDHELAAMVCGLLHRLAGLDRAYLCVFDAEGAGLVTAEHLAGPLPSLLDHRFPASDIPSNVRQIYVRNRFRCIADAEALAIELTGPPAGSPPELDLTYSLARFPAATHLSYLANMGVRSSTSFSVVRHGRLSALFGGHNVAPHVVRYRQLAACQQVVEAYAARSAVLDHDRLKRRTGAKRALIQRVVAELSDGDGELGRVIEACGPALRQLTDADGLLGRFDGAVLSTLAIDPADAAALVEAIAAQVRTTAIWASHSLAELDPGFARLAPQVSGALAIALDRDAAQLLIWTRVEQLSDQRWSGNPSEAVRLDDHGAVGPRRSFVTWVEQVSRTSRGWAPDELAVAAVVRDAINQALATLYQRRAAAAAQHANDSKTLFIANISHELRTPMHSVLGFTDVVAEGLGTLPLDRQRTLLGFVQTSGQHLLGLIDDLLDLTKLESGQMTFRFAPGSITDVIARAIIEANARLTARSVTVVVDHGDVDPWLSLDAARTVQVLVNLLANAANASPVGGQITVRLRDAGAPSRPRLQLSVEDRGAGIPDHQLEAIFDKFFQGDRRSSAPGTGGSGLGLSICRLIVAHHDGRIWATNNPDGGARMFVEYPRARELVT